MTSKIKKKETMVDWYIELQNEYINKYGPKTLIMMEVGAFYECYAVTDSQVEHLRDACRIMSIRVTRKNNKSGTEIIDSGNPYMAGVTSIAFDKYINMLLPSGYNIVRVDQVTPPPNPKREVVRVYSPGTYTESISSQTEMDNYLLILYLENYPNNNGANKNQNTTLYSIGVTLIDLTTGNSYCCEFHDNHKTGNSALSETYRVVYGYKPVESVIYTTDTMEITEAIRDRLSLDSENTRIYSDLTEQWKDLNFQETLIRRHFQCPANIDPHDFLDLGMRLHATISLVLAVQFIYEHDRDVANHLNRPKSLDRDNRLSISYHTMEILDVIPKNNSHITRKNSLLGLLDNCKTSMGKRLLKTRLLHPITNQTELERRYSLIDELGKYYTDLIDYTKFSYDLERLHRKMSLAKLSPIEFTSLDITYRNIYNISICIDKDPLIKKLLLTDAAINRLDQLNQFRESYHTVLEMDKLVKYSNLNEIYENIFIEHSYPEIDKLSKTIKEIQDELDSFRNELCILTYDGQIPKEGDKKYTDFLEKIEGLVKLEKNDRDGYLFKITKTRSKILKDHITSGDKKKFNWKQYVSSNRYLTVDSLKFNDRRSEVAISCNWLDAKSKEMVYHLEKVRSLIKETFRNCQLEWYLKYSTILSFASDFLAEIDLSLGQFEVKNKFHYVKPEIIHSIHLNDTQTKEETLITQESSENYENYENLGVSGILASEVRHPISERVRDDTTFIANPINIGSLSENNQDNPDIFGAVITGTNIFGAVITGLNGVGKSIYIKSVALAVLMAQAGLFVAAKTFKISLYNKLFTRIGNHDNLFRGQSTFYREMLELDTILRNADQNTLVIADELCSGSEQMSAQSILASTIESLSLRKTSNLITTHFHGCLSLPEIVSLEMVKFYHFKVEYQNGLLIYDRHLADGLGPKLYGIEVGRHILGEGTFIDRCYEFRQRLQGVADLLKNDVKSSKYNSEVKVEKCEICGLPRSPTETLESHHIAEQAEADKYGNIDHIAKNSKGNLVVLCKKHHQMVHHGGLEIKGWRQSVDKGLYLDYNFTDETMHINANAGKSVIKATEVEGETVDEVKVISNSNSNSNRNRKYSEVDISKVLALKEKKYKPRLAKELLETKEGFKCISEITIRKIWKGTY